jgi:hypothetical protein
VAEREDDEMPSQCRQAFTKVVVRKVLKEEEARQLGQITGLSGQLIYGDRYPHRDKGH